MIRVKSVRRFYDKAIELHLDQCLAKSWVATSLSCKKKKKNCEKTEGKEKQRGELLNSVVPALFMHSRDMHAMQRWIGTF